MQRGLENAEGRMRTANRTRTRTEILNGLRNGNGIVTTLDANRINHKTMTRQSIAACVLLLACALFLGGCQKEEHEATGEPSPAVLSAFVARFPDAREVSWGKIHAYDVAMFSFATPQRHSAWYAPGNGACALTEIELTAEQLALEAPAVLESWRTSPYYAAGCRPDEIDRLTYADREPVYRLGVACPDAARQFTYAADGMLLSDKEHREGPEDGTRIQPCPQALLDFADTHYPGAVIANFEIEDRQGVLYYEVEIFHVDERKELLFDANYTFLVCVAGIEEPEQLPEPVLQTLLALAPDTGAWDALSRYENYKGIVAAYVLKVEDRAAGRERLFKTDPAGNPIE